MKIYSLLLLAFTSFNTFSQLLPPVKELAFISGFGHGTARATLPEGVYHPLFFIAHMGNDLGRFIKNPDLKKGIFTTYTELQFNPVAIRNDSLNTGMNYSEFEFGLNSGLKYMYPITPKWFVNISGGTGPFYFSTETRQQYKGFIFNNNFGIGTSYFLTKNLAVTALFRLRHMSNANIFSPNYGINTYNYHFSISYFLF